MRRAHTATALYADMNPAGTKCRERRRTQVTTRVARMLLIPSEPKMNLCVLIALARYAQMARPKQGVRRMTRTSHLAVLTMLVTLGSGVWAFEIVDEWRLHTQPDGTTFEGHRLYDKMFVDDYVVVYGSDGWYYYAELDARGEYVASPYKVGIDDPVAIGIPKHLKRQRSAVRQAEIDAASIMQFGTGRYLTQPDGTSFLAYEDQPLPIGSCKVEVSADGYVIAIFLEYEEGLGYSYAIPIDVRIGDPASDGWYYVINYGGGDPFRAFVYDDESGWYYYAELNARGEFVASPYKVGIDNPPGHDPPTAVQERSWGAVKHLFHK